MAHTLIMRLPDTTGAGAKTTPYPTAMPLETQDLFVRELP